MSDRELLEAAAKAAGVKIIRSRLDDPMQLDMLAANSSRNAHHHSGPWNPLTDDGDALRLAVALDIAPVWGSNREVVRVDYPARFTIPLYEQVVNGDRQAATRRAIVRAAAAMSEEQA